MSQKHLFRGQPISPLPTLDYPGPARSDFYGMYGRSFSTPSFPAQLTGHSFHDPKFGPASLNSLYRNMDGIPIASFCAGRSPILPLPIRRTFGHNLVGALPPSGCAVKCAVDSHKQPVHDSKTGGRAGAISQAEHTKRGQPVLRWPPFRITLNQEVVGSNPTWPTSKIKGLWLSRSPFLLIYPVHLKLMTGFPSVYAEDIRAQLLH